jgi:stearoyl-CoA desaturase (delta-9 desaturase)
MEGLAARQARPKEAGAESDSGHATEEEEEEAIQLGQEDEQPVERQIVWANVGKFVILHSLALYGLSLLPSLSLASWTFLLTTYYFSGSGITAGAHRLWAHRSYKVGQTN